MEIDIDTLVVNGGAKFKFIMITLQYNHLVRFAL